MNKTEVNAQALSEALKEILPIERERYRDQDVNRMREIDCELKALLQRGQLAPTQLVAERLGVGKRQVSNLAVKGELSRPEKNVGGYTPAKG